MEGSLPDIFFYIWFFCELLSSDMHVGERDIEFLSKLIERNLLVYLLSKVLTLGIFVGGRDVFFISELKGFDDAGVDIFIDWDEGMNLLGSSNVVIIKFV